MGTPVDGSSVGKIGSSEIHTPDSYGEVEFNFDCAAEVFEKTSFHPTDPNRCSNVSVSELPAHSLSLVTQQPFASKEVWSLHEIANSTFLQVPGAEAPGMILGVNRAAVREASRKVAKESGIGPLDLPAQDLGSMSLASGLSRVHDFVKFMPGINTLVANPEVIKLAEDLRAQGIELTITDTHGNTITITPDVKLIALTEAQSKMISDAVFGAFLSILQQRLTQLHEQEKKLQDKLLEEQREVERGLAAKNGQEPASKIRNGSEIYENNAQAILKMMSSLKDAIRFLLKEDLNLEITARKKAHQKHRSDEDLEKKRLLDDREVKRSELARELRKERS